MQQKTILFQNRKLCYRTSGEGKGVLLLHGFGEDGTIWNNQFNAFPGYKLIIPDLPGSGGSDIIDDMSIEGLADAIKFVMDHEIYSHVNSKDQRAKPGKGTYTVIGHSMGGYITLAIADRFPELLNGFGLFHSTAYADTEEKVKTRKKGIQFIKDHGAYEFLKSSIPNLYSSVTKDNNPDLIEEQIVNSRNFSSQSLVYYYEAMILRPDRRNILKQSQLPVLFILGKYDTAVPLKDGLEQCILPVFSYIHILVNSGHMGMKEEFPESNSIISAFLNSTYTT